MMGVGERDEGEEGSVAALLVFNELLRLIADIKGRIERFRNRCAVALTRRIIVRQLIFGIVIPGPVPAGLSRVFPKPLTVMPTRLITVTGEHINVLIAIIIAVKRCASVFFIALRFFERIILVVCFPGVCNRSAPELCSFHRCNVGEGLKMALANRSGGISRLVQHIDKCIGPA